MTKIPEERALDKIMPRLKDGAMRSDEFITKEALDPIKKKVDKVIHNLHGIIIKKGSSLSLILNELENIRDQLEYHRNSVARARKENVAYVYALETLYDEYRNPETRKLIDMHNRRVSAGNNNLISEEMYEKIFKTLREKGIATFNTASASMIGVSRPSLARFIRVALDRGDITSLGKSKYELTELSTGESRELGKDRTRDMKKSKILKESH